MAVHETWTKVGAPFLSRPSENYGEEGLFCCSMLKQPPSSRLSTQGPPTQALRLFRINKLPTVGKLTEGWVGLDLGCRAGRRPTRACRSMISLQCGTSVFVPVLPFQRLAVLLSATFAWFVENNLGRLVSACSSNPPPEYRPSGRMIFETCDDHIATSPVSSILLLLLPYHRNQQRWDECRRGGPVDCTPYGEPWRPSGVGQPTNRASQPMLVARTGHGQRGLGLRGRWHVKSSAASLGLMAMGSV